MKKNRKIKNEILGKIKKKEITMTPKWRFVAWEETKRSILIAALLATGLLLGGLAYWWEIKQPTSISELTQISWKIGFESFPILLAIGVVTLVGLILIIFGKIGDNYKKRFERVALIVTILLMVIGVSAWILIHQYELEILLNLN